MKIFLKPDIDVRVKAIFSFKIYTNLFIEINVSQEFKNCFISPSLYIFFVFLVQKIVSFSISEFKS